MIRWSVKIVPDNEPNADGEWVNIDTDHRIDYDYVPKPGFHVVRFKKQTPEPLPPCVVGNQAGYCP